MTDQQSTKDDSQPSFLDWFRTEINVAGVIVGTAVSAAIYFVGLVLSHTGRGLPSPFPLLVVPVLIAFTLIQVCLFRLAYLREMKLRRSRGKTPTR